MEKTDHQKVIKAFIGLGRGGGGKQSHCPGEKVNIFPKVKQLTEENQL